MSSSGYRAVNVLGIRIPELNLTQAVTKISNASYNPEHCGFVTVTGMHGVVESQRDEELKRIHNRSFFSTPDGMSLVWWVRTQGLERIQRVYGPDLMEKIFKETEGSGVKHFFFGGAEGVAKTLKQCLLQKYPKSEVVAIQTPPFRPLTHREEQELHEKLQEVKPHLFWVGLSTPKQERFMHNFLQKYPKLNTGWGHGFTMLGVGAAFDFHSGQMKQAPVWMQQSGLEWLFRLVLEPKRLWRRYLIGIPYFLFLLVLQSLGLKKFPILK